MAVVSKRGRGGGGVPRLSMYIITRVVVGGMVVGIVEKVMEMVMPPHEMMNLIDELMNVCNKTQITH